MKVIILFIFVELQLLAIVYKQVMIGKKYQLIKKNQLQFVLKRNKLEIFIGRLISMVIFQENH